MGQRNEHIEWEALSLLEKVRNMFLSTRRKNKWEIPFGPSATKEHNPIQCPQHFGYLANRAKDDSIPQECMTCVKIVKCVEFNLNTGSRAHLQYS